MYRDTFGAEMMFDVLDFQQLELFQASYGEGERLDE